MSDIFISYAKADHALALKLSAFLESEGWSVWWDKSLGVADLYRDEIMKQLAAARAVITIWTENSIKSDWVRAEAGRAKADGKLIPVKTSDVAYADIPLPFGEMHTENVGSNDLIRAAVFAFLAKPKTPATPFWQVTGLFKYQALTWIGIGGSAITLFANLKGILELADWARALVAHWHEWTQTLWQWIFGWIGIKVPKEFVPLISFTVFAALLVAGTNLSGKGRARLDGVGVGWFFVTSWLMPVMMALVMIAIILSHFVLPLSDLPKIDSGLFGYIFLILLVAWPVGTLFSIYGKEDRLWTATAGLLFCVMGVDLFFVPYLSILDLEVSNRTLFFLAAFLSLYLLICMAVIMFSPVRQLTRRLAFVALGVLILVGLSEISKLDLHQYLQPPKVSDNSVR
jgi:hypothetical protein